MTETDTEVREGRFFAIVAYISFFCMLTFLLKKENKFALFHAKQGLVLFVLESAALILSIIPLLEFLLRTVGAALFIGFSVWGMVQAWRGAYAKMPLVSKVAEEIIL
jgi:fumarate reductase subunit D